MNRCLAVCASVVLLAFSQTAQADILYHSSPNPLPPNLPSLGYQATSTGEFGDIAQLAGVAPQGYSLSSITITMSNWAYQSAHPGFGTAAGYNVPITLNLYNVGPGNTVGSLFATQTVIATIPWRPEPDGAVPGGPYTAGDGFQYNGSLSQVTFNLNNAQTNGQFIYGIEYNTQTYGDNPTGVAGPYNSLNVALNTVPPSVGTDLIPGSVYWNTSFAGFYTDGGAGGVGTFRQDTNWAPYTPAVTVQGVINPEPASMLAWGLIVGVGAAGYRLRKRTAAVA